MASPYGAPQLPPLNAPPGNAPQPGVQPGADGAIVAGLVIVFGPPGSGSKAVIGPIPPELLAYYQTRLGTVATFAITMYPNGTSYHYEIVGTGLLAPTIAVYGEGMVNNGIVTEFRRMQYDSSLNVVDTLFNQLATAGPTAATWTYGFDIMSGLGPPQNVFKILQSTIVLGSNTPGVTDTGSIIASVPSNWLADMKYAGVSMPRAVAYTEFVTFAFTSGAVAGVEQVAFTTTNTMTLQPNRAYRVQFSAQIKSAAVQNPVVQIRENNLAGTLLIAGGRWPVGTINNDLDLQKWGVICNFSATTPVTCKLCVTVVPQVGTAVVIEAGTNAARARFDVVDCGDSLTSWTGTGV